MKPAKPPPISVPRVNSLLHRLQKMPGPDEVPYLDQLMIFLDDPPAGDRWKKGAAMCVAWGITCSHTSVYRLYQSYVITWRATRALRCEVGKGKSLKALGQKARHLLAMRACEILGDPNASHQTLLGMARIGVRREALDLARERFQDTQRKLLDRAMAEMRQRCCLRRDASFALDQLEITLSREPEPISQEVVAFLHSMSMKRKERRTQNALRSRAEARRASHASHA